MVSTPGAGHVFPLVTLAWALRLAGHEVLIASNGVGVGHATDAGLLATDVAPGFDLYNIILQSRFSPASSETARHDAAVAMFTTLNRGMLDGLRRCARAWRPDAIVYGSVEAAGAVVAFEMGIPGIELAVTPARPLGAMVSAIWPHIADSDPVDPTAAISPLPRSLAPAPTPGWVMRAEPYHGGATVPTELLEPPLGPRVLVTMGTFIADRDGVDVVRLLADAVAEEPAEVVVALGADPVTLGALPPSVRAYRWVPLHVVLPHCAAVLYHGGSGTMVSALGHGVPQVVIPLVADQFLNAEMLERRGCGIRADADPAAIRAALRRALAGELDASAAEVRSEIGTLPPPTVVANELVDLVTRQLSRHP